MHDNRTKAAVFIAVCESWNNETRKIKGRKISLNIKTIEIEKVKIE